MRRRPMTAEPPPPAHTRPIADFGDPRTNIPGYAVASDGSVWWLCRARRGWFRSKEKTGPYGFRRVRMRIAGRVREIGVAQLVLRAWVGPRPVGCEPLHFPDQDPGNNRVENLRWSDRGSSKVGQLCSGRPPVAAKGESHYLAILTDEKVVEIRAQYRAGFRYKEIAADLGISEELARRVLVGKAWRHVPDPLGPIVMHRKGPAMGDAHNAVLDRDGAREIRRRHAGGESYVSLAKRFGIHKCTVRDVVKRRTWKDA
jgi:hypothetical protein